MKGRRVWPVMLGRWEGFPVAVFSSRSKAREYAKAGWRLRVGGPISLDPMSPVNLSHEVSE